MADLFENYGLEKTFFLIGEAQQFGLGDGLDV